MSMSRYLSLSLSRVCVYMLVGLRNGTVAVAQLVAQVHLQLRVGHRAFARVGEQCGGGARGAGGVVERHARRAERRLDRAVVAVGADRVAARRLAGRIGGGGAAGGGGGGRSRAQHKARLHLEDAVLDATALLEQLRIDAPNVDIGLGRALDMAKLPVDADDRVGDARAQRVRLVGQVWSEIKVRANKRV